MIRLKKFVPIVGAIVLAFATLGAGVMPAFAKGNGSNAQVNVTANKPASVSLGNARIFIDESGFNGKLILNSIPPTQLRGLAGVGFRNSVVKVSYKVTQRIAGGNVQGEMFIYYTLTQKQYNAWQQGKLAIYHYNRSMSQWVKLTTLAVHLVKEKPSRMWTISARGDGYGIYGLGELN